MISSEENQSMENTQPNVVPKFEPPTAPKPQKIKKIKTPWSKKKKVGVTLGIIGGILLLAGAAFAVWYFFLQPNESDYVTQPPEQVHYYSPLTGVEVETEELTKLPVTAVIIENSPDARPQSGLVGNNVVFEAVAEGGITRFNMLFQEYRPALIGPVRSLRSYYLEWAAGFDAAQAHVGGSGDALAMIRSGGYGLDIDEMILGYPIWRVSDRWAPHNAYTDAANLSQFQTERGKVTSEFTAWERQDGGQIRPPEVEETADLDEGQEPIIDTNIYAYSINFPVSTGIFAVSYEYNADTNSYNRFQGGVAHLDREKGQISPDVVIAMMVNQSLKSNWLHNDIVAIGSGIAYVFQNGIMEQCTWKKDSAHTNIVFTNNEGENVALNRGQTWITAIDNAKTPTWQ